MTDNTKTPTPVTGWAVIENNGCRRVARGKTSVFPDQIEAQRVAIKHTFTTHKPTSLKSADMRGWVANYEWDDDAAHRGVWRSMPSKVAPGGYAILETERVRATDSKGTLLVGKHPPGTTALSGDATAAIEPTESEK